MATESKKQPKKTKNNTLEQDYIIGSARLHEDGDNAKSAHTSKSDARVASTKRPNQRHATAPVVLNGLSGQRGQVAGGAGANDAVMGASTPEVAAAAVEGNNLSGDRDSDADMAEVNTKRLEGLSFDDDTVREVRISWSRLVANAGSEQAVGEAFFTAMFDGSPTFEKLFVSPRAVHAAKFVASLNNLIMILDDPARLKAEVESLGFLHWNIEVTVPRIIVFRDAILSVIGFSLTEEFTDVVHTGWKNLLNYVGGACMFVKTHFAERLRILEESWAIITNKTGRDDGRTHSNDEGSSQSGEIKPHSAAGGPRTSAQAKKRGMGRMRHSFNFKRSQRTDSERNGYDDEHNKNRNHHDQDDDNSASIPTTYDEMFQFNAVVMGLADNTWMPEVLACFDNIVTNIGDSSRCQEECDVLALRIAKVTNVAPELSEYKSCMLASLRSLLPKDWSTSHEVAWSWLWDSVERFLQKNLGRTTVWQRSLSKLLGGLEEDLKYQVHQNIYNLFFQKAPTGQEFFKQSNTYLHWIAERVLQMTSDFFKDPVQMVDDISALGLRHVGYAIPVALFPPFVASCSEVMGGVTRDDEALKGFHWSLMLVSKILVRTINEGSTVVMKAIHTNSAKRLRHAMGCAPRGERAHWVLTVQVGTQSISPLLWALESRKLEASSAIIEDLLTIRADRLRYYYGMDELFTRHPDIINVLITDTPSLLPVVFEGLIWRSRVAQDGERRVNYYVKHLIVAEDGGFSKTMEWFSAANEPKIMTHPVLTWVSDTLWQGTVRGQFSLQKVWFLLNLGIFMLAQVIMPKLDGRDEEYIRWLGLIAKATNYIFGFGRLALPQSQKCFECFVTRDFIWILRVIPIPKYLSDTFEATRFGLMLLIVAMCSHEPMLWCMQDSEAEFPAWWCEEADYMEFRYSVFTMLAIAMNWFLAVDMCIFSMEMSAFVLVCRHVISEIQRFLVALVFLLLTFGSAVSVVDHGASHMQSTPRSALALFAITIRVYEEDFKDIEDPAVLYAVLLYVTASSVVMLNLLIAQLQCSYVYVNQDMIGFARLNRAACIIEVMSTYKRSKWAKFVHSLGLDIPLEFNHGDIGPSGGMTHMEPSSLHPVVVERIKRVGGSCNPTLPWPDEALADGDLGKFERMERIIQKAMNKLAKASGGDSSGGVRSTSSGSIPKSE